MPDSHSWIMELHLNAKNKHSTLQPFASLEDSPKGSSQTTDSDGIRDDTPQNSDSSDTTTSSSSSDSSSDDSLQVNLPSRSSGSNSISKPTGDVKPLYKNDHADDFSSKALFRLGEYVDESPTSQVSDITHESLVPIASPTQSPPPQVMARSPGVFDPDRIPASIFSGPSTPTDWSVASNESLFSIHIGNNSFSKDHGLKMSNELQRPEELHNSKELSEEVCGSGEVYNSGELYRTGDLEKNDLYPLEECYKSSELIELVEHIRSKESVQAKKGTEDSTEESPIATRQAHANDKLNTNFRGPRDSSVLHQLDKSQPVIQSSPFSKKKKSSCLHCQCSDCYETLFCCKFSGCFECSGCSCKWLSCSGCSCKWLSCMGCSCKWHSCMGCSCKWLSCMGCSCKWLRRSRCSCKWLSCSNCSCNWLSCSRCSCKWFSWPSCSGNCLSCQGCCWPSCDYNCLSWSSCCTCHSRSCTCACFSCWKSKPKKPCYGSSYKDII